MLMQFVDPIGSGSSLSHGLRRLYSTEPFKSSNTRCGRRAVVVFAALAILAIASASLFVFIMNGFELGGLASHTKAWHFAVSYVALLAVIMIDYSFARDAGSTLVPETVVAFLFPASIRLSPDPRPPTTA